jgi:hypothetical protein
MRPFTNQHSVHLALAFLFGAMDRQASQQESDDVFVCVVIISEGESWIPADHRIFSEAAE